MYVSHSVTSNSLWPHRLYPRPDSSVHGILPARILECQRAREIEFRSWRQNHQSKPLDQWSVTRPSPLGFAEEVFPQRWKVVKQVKYLLGGNRVQYMWIDRWADPEKESPWVAPSCSLYYFYGAFLPGFLWSVILVCLFTVHIWCISEPSHMCTHIPQPRGILPKRLMGS